MDIYQRTVLVVDDELPVREILGRFLRQAGYEVNGASDGKEALDILQRGKLPDLIVLDLMMPVMSGFEVLNALRANPTWAKIPVIVLTATMGFSAGRLLVDATLQKPFEMVDVQAAIHVALASKRDHRP
jgi:CheY-like chemotaxis protein